MCNRGGQWTLPCLVLWSVCALSAQSLTPPAQTFILRVSAPSGLGYTTSVSLGSTFTMECWVELEVATPGAVLMGKTIAPPGGDPYTNYVLGMDGSGLKPVFIQTTGAVGSFVALNGTSTLTLHTWTHLAAVLSGGTMSLYINGVLNGTVAGPGPPRGASVPFGVGGAMMDINTPCCANSAGMRQARVWNVALNATQLQAYAQQTLTGKESGLLADWPLDDGAGLTARDVGPNGFALSLVGNTQWAHTAMYDGGPYWKYTPFTSNNNGGGTGTVVDMGVSGLTAVMAFQHSITVPGPAAAFRWIGNSTSGAFTDVTDTVIPTQISVLSPRDWAVADFNGDGLPDVFLASHGLDESPDPGGQSQIFIQSANGQLLNQTASLLPQVMAFTHNVAAADVNGDGSIDLYMCRLCCTSPGPELYLNDGTGHFTATTAGLPSFVAFRTPATVFSASRFIDANNDGYPDLVLGSDPMQTTNLLLLNDGRGNFTPSPVPLPAKYGGLGWGSPAITIADFDGDGYPDILFVMIQNYGGNVYLQLLLNNHDGTFRDASANIPQDFPDNIPTGWIEWATVADVNNDGWPDIITNGGGYAPHLYINNGDGTFTDATEAMPTLQDNQVFAGDFIGNGKTHLFFANYFGNYSFAQNLLPIGPVAKAPPGPFRPAPTITSLSTTSSYSGAPGFTLTVNGTGFISGVSKGRWNGSVRLTTFVSATQLTMVVTTADLATGGRYAVTVWNPQPGGGVSPAAYVTVISCTFQLSPSSASPSASATTGTITMTGPTGCPWTAASNSGFLAVTSGTPGSGNGTVGYSVAANTGFGRTGTLTVAGQTFTVNQFSNRNELDVTAATSQADLASIPIYLNLDSNTSLANLTVTVTVTSVSGAPAPTIGTLGFASDPAQPAPSTSTSGSNAITLTYSGLSTPLTGGFAGGLHLGNVLVNVPRLAVNGQTYTVHVTGTEPGGPDVLLTVAAQLAAWTSTSKIAMSYFYYWYDVYNGSHFVSPSGATLLTDHPPTSYLSNYSYTDPNWHQTQLQDMTAAGIDVVLPDYWGDTADQVWSLPGLANLVTASQALVQAGTPGPMIGMFYDTIGLINQNGGTPPDLTTSAGKTIFYGMMHDYFSRVPSNLWATINGRPIVVLNISNVIAAWDQTTFTYVNQQFQADFGVTPYIILERSWTGVTTDAAYGLGASLTGPIAVGDVVDVSPGANNAAVAALGEGPNYRSRDCVAFYEDGWNAILARGARLVLIETWNQYHEGTDVAASLEYGRQFITVSGQKIAQWKSTPFSPSAPAVAWVNPGKDGYQASLLPANNLGLYGDGSFLKTRISGRDAVYVNRTTNPPSNYIYFDVNDSFQHATQGQVYVTVEYFDSGNTYWGLGYDGAAGPYEQATFVAPTNTNTWLVKTFVLPDAYFGGRQNGWADLRIDDYNTQGVTHYFGRVRISKTPPSSAPPSITALSDVVMAPGTTMDIPLSASAAAGLSLVYSTAPGPGFASVNGSVLHLAPANTDVRACPYPVTALATENSTPALADSASLRVTVVPFPSISSLSATSALAGTAGFTLTVNGANFTATSQVQWGATGLATTLASATQLTALVPTPDLASAGSFNISVADTAGGTSSAVPFVVVASCSFQLSSTSATAMSGASSGSVMVTAPVGCSWTASSNSAFLGIASGTPGSGSGAVGYTVAANTGLARAGTLTVAGQTFTVNQSSGINELDSAAAAASPGSVARIPLTLSLASGITPTSLTVTVTLTPVSTAPALTAVLSFSNDAAQPVPSISEATTTSITFAYSNLATPLSGTLHLGDVLGTLPTSATVGQTYTIHLRSVSSPVSAGVDQILTVATLYLVGDVYPTTGHSAGQFGDGAINTLDLIATLRAVVNLAGFVPPACSDLFDAMDAYPADGSGNPTILAGRPGGDGVLNTLDLIATLRRATNIDTTRPTRTSRGLTCPAAATQERRPHSKSDPGAPEALLQFGTAARSGGKWRTPVYLHTKAALSLLGLGFSAGDNNNTELDFIAGDRQAPNLIDAGVSGTIAVAWLNGLSANAGSNILLGYIETTVPPSLTLLGVSANESGSGRTVNLAWTHRQ